VHDRFDFLGLTLPLNLQLVSLREIKEQRTFNSMLFQAAR